MNVTLYVWKLRPDNPGHASLQMGTAYVSYWPSDAAGKKDVKIGQTHEAAFPKSYAVDVRLERKAADEQRTLTTLDAPAMIQAWDEFRAAPRKYNMVEHNCSTVIASLLALGSNVKPSFVPSVAIDDHAESLAQRLFLRVRFFSGSIRMWTPDAVLRYADEIKQQARPR